MIPDIYVPKYALGILLAIVVLFEIRRSSFPKWVFNHASAQWVSYLKILMGTAALSIAVMAIDGPLLARIQSFENPAKETLANLGRFFGRSHGTWTLLAFIFLAGYISRKPFLQRMAFFALLSSCVTGLIGHILKFIFLRARPYKDLGPYKFFDLHGFIDHSRAFQSFPSGDVAVAAGAAGYLFMRIQNPILKITVLILPFLTALSRVDLNRHWPSDTLFSIGLGLTIGMFLRDHERGIIQGLAQPQAPLKGRS